MKQHYYNRFLYSKPGQDAGFALSAASRPATCQLLLCYYSATIKLLFTCPYPGLTRRLTGSCYGLTGFSPALSLALG